MTPNLFCHAFPADWNNAHAVQIRISKEAKKKYDSIPHGEAGIQQGVVAFDRLSGKWFAIRHHPCQDSFACCCASQAKELKDKNEKWEWPPIEFPDFEEEEEE